MDIKTEIVALAVRAIANKTGLIRKPDALEELIGSLFGTESYDVHKAKQIIAATDRIRATRQARKLKKTTQQETETIRVSSERV